MAYSNRSIRLGHRATLPVPASHFLLKEHRKSWSAGTLKFRYC